jgi:hypothetical protein
LALEFAGADQIAGKACPASGHVIQGTFRASARTPASSKLKMRQPDHLSDLAWKKCIAG